MRDLRANRQLDKVLIEQAFEWLEVLKQDDPEDRKAFTNWLLQSKRHVRAHLFITMLDAELNHIDPQRKIPIPDFWTGMGNVARLDVARSESTARQEMRLGGCLRRWPLAAAAITLIVLGSGVITLLWKQELIGPHRWQEFATEIGEQRTITLMDGSLVQLNTQSNVRLRLTEKTREIRLLSGEALFKVHHDRARPFLVETSGATIRVVGTQFNVYAAPGATKVAVLEGKVSVSAENSDSRVLPPKQGGGAELPSGATETARDFRASSSAGVPSASAPATFFLVAGEEAEIGDDGQIDRRRVPDVANLAAWVQRRLVFKQEPLANVVAEFNRYKRQRFRVDDPALAARKYSGVFDVDDPKSLEDLLAAESDISVIKDGEETVIQRRAAAEPQ
jgi:transmembrane sensor